MPYDFDVEFQRCLLAAVLGDEKFSAKAAGVIRSAFFTDELLGGIAASVLSFRQREAKHPDPASLLEEVKAHVAPGRKWGEYADELGKIRERNGTNPDYYKRMAVEFARRHSMIEAVNEAHERLINGDVDGVIPVIQKAAAVGQELGTEHYDYLNDAGGRMKRYLGHVVGSSVPRVSTGIAPLDAATQGGLGPGELGVVMALPKHGKTTVLTAFGKRAVLDGKNVLHVTLENSREVTAARYDSSFSMTPMEQMKKAPVRFLKTMRDLVQSLSSRLKIAYYPTRSLTLLSLAGTAASMENLDLLIVDYADLLRPSRKQDERRHELTDLYEGLRRVAGEVGVPIWTASQANRPGFGAKVLGMEHIAEDLNKVAIMDLGISVSYDEIEAHRGQMKLFVMGNRLGPSGFEIDCEVDFATASLRPILDEV